MWTIRRDQRGVSNIIVVVLGLVIIVIITSNVILWSYEMNQLDWEKMREDIAIASVTGATDAWPYNASGYTLEGSTSWVSGSVSNLTSGDGVYMTFRSYYSGDTSDFVDETRDLYPPSAKGTHSNFSAQQGGPDLINDTLTEENTGGVNTLELWVDGFDNNKKDWDVNGTTPYLSSIDYPTNYIFTDVTGGTEERFDFTNTSATGVINDVKICVYARNDGNEQLEISIYNSTSRYNIATPTPSSDWAWYNYSCLSILPTWTQVNYAKLRVQMIKVGGSSTVYVDAALLFANYTSPDNYRLDLEVQWTSVDYDETNEYLCVYGGTMGSENITVDVWYSSAWQNLFTDLSSGWNNVSVSSYLDSLTFTIRFKDDTETGDTSQDSWDIDVTLLHVWSDEYTSEVEFTGSSNMENWSQLNWTVDSAWTIGSVSVTLQLYNYTLDDYPASGNGYIAYTSDSTPNTDETESPTINVNPAHFRNATGYWKLKVKGVKTTDTQFDSKVDWIEFKVVNADTIFTFENGGSLTCHLVSLWVINSTVHEHYDMSVFINSGDTLSYSRMDIILPNGQYTVKVVTERGNIAVYSGS